MNFGDIDVHPLTDGRFRLDGGAMFGVVPRVLWEKLAPPDEAHRITLRLRPLLVRTPKRNILIDAGMGEKWDEKGRAMFAIERDTTLLGELARHGLGPQDIDLVILSHLHFDHAGNCTCLDGAGRLVPTFPRARIIVQRGEWADAQDRAHLRRASYREENLAPLDEHGVLELIDGDQEIEPGLRVHVTGGHTPHHQVVFIEGGARTGIYFGDLIPTAAHAPAPYIMAYDVDPAATLKAKERLCARAVAEDWVIFWDHDPQHPCSRLLRDERGRFQAVALADLAC